MNINSITAVLRPRSDWESIDLGTRLTQRHAGMVFLSWFVASLPWALLIGVACYYFDKLAFAPLIFWWFKPLFDRAPLHVLGRALFGATPDRHETLTRSFGLSFSASPLWAITLGRFSASRSFHLPVWQLEGLRGKARRARSDVLEFAGGGAAMWLTILLLHVVLLLHTNLLMFLLSFVESSPVAAELSDPLERLQDSLLAITESPQHVLVMSYAVYYAVESFIEPYYVGAGFGLYLNRRTRLEAWDLELGFRQMAARRRATPLAGATACVAAIVGLLAFTGPTPALAQTDNLATQPAAEEIESAINEILAQPEFKDRVTRKIWVRKSAAKNDDELNPGRFVSLPWLGALSELLLWTALAALIALIIVYRDRWFPYLLSERTAARSLPDTDSGLLLDPVSLPADLPSEVRRLWSQNRHAAALSLLYRGALTRLNERLDLRIPTSATESDCVNAVQNKASTDVAGYFAAITHAWQHVAYGARKPSEQHVIRMCEEWQRYVGAS